GKELDPPEKIADEVVSVVERILRKRDPAGFGKTAVADRLRSERRSPAQRSNRDARRATGARHWRRSACNVKSSSFIGRLYSSLSSVSRVRLPRRTSDISRRRAVQIP